MTSPRDIDELQRAFRAGSRLELVFFWTHERAGGNGNEIGPECLSQWYPSAFVIDGVRYATAEHFMMASKARLFADLESEQAILKAPSPAVAKALGRRVRGFDEPTWEGARFRLVLEGNSSKFEQHPELRAFLLGTGERVLAEASPTDRIWGIGLGADDPQACNPLQWRGLSLLGFALMQVREQLR